ncbi:MAG: hypothetical protein JW839_09465 [Candidatus Lokiarchaeota archaeon]|nr:hypothetical protein [Candidatus Lokiarchaeota archaeon]
MLAPRPGADGIYYLRVRAQDEVGNNASWVTLYEFRYEAGGQGPLDPDQAVVIVLLISCGAAIGVAGLALVHKRGVKRGSPPGSK